MKPTVSDRLRSTAALLQKRQTCAILLAAALAAILLLLAAALLFAFLPIRESTAFTISLTVTLAAALAGLVAAIRVWTRPPPLSHLAAKLENRHPEWMDAFICAVELEQKPAADRRPLESALVEKINRDTAPLDFTAELLPRFWQKRALLSALAVFLLLLVACAFTPFFAKTRHHLADLGKPTSGLRIQPGNAETPIRSDLRIHAEILRWEDKPTIEYTDETGRHSFPMNRDADAHSFTFYDIREPISYRVSTPSLRSPWYQITPYIPPTIDETEILIQPPAYTRLPQQTLSELVDFSAIAGSQIHWKIRSASAQSASLETGADPLPLEPAPENTFTRSTVAAESFTARVSVRDAENRSARTPPFQVTVTPDEPPTIEVTHPGQDTEATPDAKVALRTLAADDFGLTRIELHVSVSGQRAPIAQIFRAEPDAEPTLENQLTVTLDLPALQAVEGDVVTYFFTATDNRDPNPQQTRSEIYFIEVREEIIPEEMEGQPMELERIDLQALILELKRLIRLSWETLPHDDLAREREIASGLGEIRLEIARVQQEVIDQAGPEEAAPLVTLLGRAAQRVEEAAARLAQREVEPSIPLQEMALAELVAIQTQLMKNQAQSKDPSESSSSGPSPQQQPESPSDEQLAALQELQRQVQQMADSQAAQSSALRRLQSLNPEQQTDLQNRQQALREEAQQTADALSGASGLESIRRDLASAAGSMQQSEQSISQNNPAEAARSGDRARSSLLSALERIDDAIGQATGNQITQLANQANQLAQQQGQAAGGSRGLAQSDSPNPEEAAALREQQQSLQQSLENLLAGMNDTASQLRDSNPEAARAVAEAGQQIREQNVAAQMGRAGNALLYRQFERAAEMQETAAAQLGELAQNLEESSSLLPSMSRQQMERLLSQLEQARQEVLSMTGQSLSEISEQLPQLTDRLGERVGQAGKSLNNSQLQEISGELRGTTTGDGQTPNLFRTETLLRAAARTLEQQLFALEMERRTRLQRQTSEPPEEYRTLVEEYFRTLSETP